jgi:hypothetical protein
VSHCGDVVCPYFKQEIWAYACCYTINEALRCECPSLQGVWKDTLWIKSQISSPTGLTNPPTGIYKVVIRTRYERYIGQFVLHCHILDHEDQGMMPNVSIGIPPTDRAAPHTLTIERPPLSG